MTHQSPFPLEGYGATHLGGNTRNEDYFRVDDKVGLFAVADGVANLPAPAVAAEAGDLATMQRYAAVVEGDRGAALRVLDRAYQDARDEVGRASDAARKADRPARRRSTRRRVRLTGGSGNFGAG